MPMKLYVGTSGCDDVGTILRRMGQGFEYEPLGRYRSVAPQEAVVFLNCQGSSLAANELRQFVEAGGTVYASCYQASIVAQAFSDTFRKKDVLMMGRMPATVEDQGLATIVGGQMSLNFNTPWRYLLPKAQTGSEVCVYLKSKRSWQPVSWSVQGGTPIVLSYVSGQGGTLFFTAFHNIVQKSETEEELLRFLIFRPLMARDLHQQRNEMAERAAHVEREFTSGLSKRTPQKVFPLDKDADWRASLSWSGQGKLCVELLDGSGATLAAQDNWSSPVAVAGRVAGGGQVRVRCLEFVQSEIPFSLLIATGGEASRGAPPPTSLPPTAAPPAPSGRDIAPPPGEAPVARPGGLTLEAENGRKFTVRIATPVGKHALGQLGDDSKFYSDPQFRLSQDAAGGWQVEPDASARNVTMLNGTACTSVTALKEGDVLAVGNPAKGITKLPLRVRFEG